MFKKNLEEEAVVLRRLTVACRLDESVEGLLLLGVHCGHHALAPLSRFFLVDDLRVEVVLQAFSPLL